MPTDRPFVFLLAGCTNSGKSTLTKAFIQLVAETWSVKGEDAVRVVRQDDFFLLPDQVELVPSRSNPGTHYHNYDVTLALNRRGIEEAVNEALRTPAVRLVIVEGNMLTDLDEIMRVADRVLFLTLDVTTCRRRRVLRTYEPPDLPGFFEEIVWPNYEQLLERALQRAHTDDRIAFIDCSSMTDDVKALPDFINSLLQQAAEHVLRVVVGPIDVNECWQQLGTPSTCGGTSLFIGTTRSHFNGRTVTKLSYETTDAMAMLELRSLARRTSERFGSLRRILIVHRIGEVPVGQTSVVIGAAAPHRADAIQAVDWMVTELKAKVPIWKRESYADGQSNWKENAECCARHATTAQNEEVAANKHDRRSVKGDERRDLRDWVDRLFSGKRNATENP